MPRSELDELLRLYLSERNASAVTAAPDLDQLADRVASSVAARLGIPRRTQLDVLADKVASRLGGGLRRERVASASEVPVPQRVRGGGVSASPIPAVSASPIPAVSASPIPAVSASPIPAVSFSPASPALRSGRTLTDSDVEAVASALVRRLGAISASPIPAEGVVLSEGPAPVVSAAMVDDGPVSAMVKGPSGDVGDGG